MNFVNFNRYIRAYTINYKRNENCCPIILFLLTSGSRRVRESEREERWPVRQPDTNVDRAWTAASPAAKFCFPVLDHLAESLWLCKSPRLASLATKTNRLVNSHHSSYCLCDTAKLWRNPPN